MFKGIDATRDLFNELKKLEPACLKLYLVMIAMEREEPNHEIDTVRNLYKEVTTLCGKNNVGKSYTITIMTCLPCHKIIYLHTIR